MTTRCANPDCGLLNDAARQTCLGCGWVLTGTAQGSACTPSVSRPRRGPVQLASYMQTATSPRPLDLGIAPLRARHGTTITIKGAAGGGKSTALTGMCITAAYQVPVLVVSAEEGAEGTALERFRRVAAMLKCPIPPALFLTDARTVAEADHDLRAWEAALGSRRGLVAIDSLTQLRAPQQWWEGLVASGHTCIFILHCVTSGHARGGLEPEYAADVNITVDEHGLATITKSRWGPTGPEHSFDARRPAPLKLKQVQDNVVWLDKEAK